MIPRTPAEPCRLNPFTTSLVMPITIALVVDAGSPKSVMLTFWFASKAALNPAGMTMPSEADFEERYWEKFWSNATVLRQSPEEAAELQLFDVPFRAEMNALLMGPES